MIHARSSQDARSRAQPSEGTMRSEVSVAPGVSDGGIVGETGKPLSRSDGAWRCRHGEVVGQSERRAILAENAIDVRRTTIVSVRGASGHAERRLAGGGHTLRISAVLLPGRPPWRAPSESR